jgi:hypothetical protein
MAGHHKYVAVTLGGRSNAQSRSQPTELSQGQGHHQSHVRTRTRLVCNLGRHFAQLGFFATTPSHCALFTLPERATFQAANPLGLPRHAARRFLVDSATQYLFEQKS